MKEYEYLDELISRYPVLAPVKADIRTAYETLKECYERGGKLLIAGNGGSCADSEHIVGELMKGFVKKRPVSEEIEKALKTVDPQMGAELSEKLQQGLPAIALTGHAGLTTAFMNDVDGSMTYAEQGVPLADLTSLDLQRFYKHLLDGGRVDRIEAKKKPKGLAPKTVRNIHQMIGSAYNLAIEQHLVTKIQRRAEIGRASCRERV